MHPANSDHAISPQAAPDSEHEPQGPHDAAHCGDDPAGPNPAGLHFAHLLRSEFIKLTSLRSTVLALLALVGGGLVISLLLASTMESAGIPDSPSTLFALQTLLVTVNLGQLIAGVLGVLTISSEYSSGTIQVSLAAVPRRLPMLAAKAVVLFSMVVLAALITTFGSWALTYGMFDALGIAVGLDAPGFALALIGGSVYVGLTALFGLGVGTILRSASGGIASVLGVLLILPVGLSLFGGSFPWLLDVQPYLLSQAGESMTELASSGGPERGARLPAAAGAVVAFTWSAVTLVLGAITLRRRDA